jgi:hypothetical protein
MTTKTFTVVDEMCQCILPVFVKQAIQRPDPVDRVPDLSQPRPMK